MFLAVLVVIGALLTWGLTETIFGKAPGSALGSAALVWLIFGIMLIALMTLLCVLIGSTARAAGAGLGVYALVSTASEALHEDAPGRPVPVVQETTWCRE